MRLNNCVLKKCLDKRQALSEYNAITDGPTDKVIYRGHSSPKMAKES